MGLYGTTFEGVRKASSLKKTKAIEKMSNLKIESTILLHFSISGPGIVVLWTGIWSHRTTKLGEPAAGRLNALFNLIIIHDKNWPTNLNQTRLWGSAEHHQLEKPTTLLNHITIVRFFLRRIVVSGTFLQPRHEESMKQATEQRRISNSEHHRSTKLGQICIWNSWISHKCTIYIGYSIQKSLLCFKRS